MLFDQLVERILVENIQQISFPLAKIKNVFISAIRVIFDLDQGDIAIEEEDPHIMTRKPTESVTYPNFELNKFNVQNWKTLIKIKYKKPGNTLAKVYYIAFAVEQNFTPEASRARYERNYPEYLETHTLYRFDSEIQRDKDNFIVEGPNDSLTTYIHLATPDRPSPATSFLGFNINNLNEIIKRIVEELKDDIDTGGMFGFDSDDDKGGPTPDKPVAPKPTGKIKTNKPTLVPA